MTTIPEPEGTDNAELRPATVSIIEAPAPDAIRPSTGWILVGVLAIGIAGAVFLAIGGLPGTHRQASAPSGPRPVTTAAAKPVPPSTTNDAAPPAVVTAAPDTVEGILQLAAHSVADSSGAFFISPPADGDTGADQMTRITYRPANRALRIDRANGFWFGEDRAWRNDLLDAVAAQAAALLGRSGRARPTRVVAVRNDGTHAVPRSIRRLTRPWTDVEARRARATMTRVAETLGLDATVFKFQLVVVVVFDLPPGSGPTMPTWRRLVGAWRRALVAAAVRTPVIVHLAPRAAPGEREPRLTWWWYATDRGVTEGQARGTSHGPSVRIAG
jgi:hypothetical protein